MDRLIYTALSGMRGVDGAPERDREQPGEREDHRLPRRNARPATPVTLARRRARGARAAPKPRSIGAT